MGEPAEDDERGSAGTVASVAAGDGEVNGGDGAVASLAAYAPGGGRALSPQPAPWWWRERPQRGLSRFGRGVWWAGHVQLPVALGLLLVCLPLFVVGATSPSLAGPAWIGLAMSGPFALSGRMLRASAGWQIYWSGPAGSGGVTRTVALIATVAGIAALSILLTVAAAYVLFFIAAAISQMT